MKFALAILLALTTLATTQEMMEEPRVVDVSAKRFEFTPSEIHLKRGETVTLRLNATDRPHGLLINALHVDLDADVDRPDSVTITPHTKGTYPAICDHYCGAGHGNMKMTIVVE